MAFIKKKTIASNIPTQYEALSTPDDVLRLAESKGIETEPLDVADLVKALGIKVYFEPMPGDDSGSLTKNRKTGEWKMLINSLHHPHRQRFTIAHEIGHHIKHGAFKDSFTDTTFFRNGESNQMESEANKFAAELLMPEKRFNALIESGKVKVEELAEYFQVSSMAVRIRAKQLGYEGHNV
ncbi:ImmA/IrrE family metallo-endopeptidase [Vibrio scophthalmi]|uniref:ImmA/IrrE family metallo-endopeptidase n=1 Tax=Vibrio scophthalmi TaxID=45658 RepID=UPI002283AAAF|nr:ImmA/IrrE family metallo-endopeptidase [Vibrio scophthalmi]MCY9802662.1 ImmA/IrrE family metallo-endopeptidase [Vibrio scophthalmi]